MQEPNKDIFCNSPWYELQIYWDGGLGFCCAEDHRIYSDDQSLEYNIKQMSIRQWFNSDPMKKARLAMFGHTPNSYCARCYKEESLGQSSRRIRSNQKSVIFKSAWHDSFEQSPGLEKFLSARDNQGEFQGMPIDVHIDLGNFCNLTCKMCSPKASSGIAVQHVKWGITEAKKYVGTDWTKDTEVWNRTLKELSEIPNLKNVHFMGGETLITPRFEEFVSYMDDKKRHDLSFSFVTNGTTWNQSLLEKLKKFSRLGIEVSVETLTEHNSYQRQGTDNAMVLENLKRYANYCDGSHISLTIRPAISALSIGYYDSLLQYCLDNNVVVKSLLCYRPRYYDPRILPNDVKSVYLTKYQDFLSRNDLNDIDLTQDFNESDPNQIRKIIAQQVLACINILKSPWAPDHDILLAEMVQWCRRWDEIHGYDARVLYPELIDILDQHGY